MTNIYLEGFLMGFGAAIGLALTLLSLWGYIKAIKALKKPKDRWSIH